MTRRLGGYDRRLVLAIVALATSPLGCDTLAPGSSADSRRLDRDGPVAATSSPYDPDIDPERFVGRIDNPYLPLIPGTVFRLRGETAEGTESETVTVTNRTKKILGVTTTVVEDVARVEGEIKELTYDWFAQDAAGNVWYFGENTAEYENGKVTSRSGSWKAGRDGAEAGIVMGAAPRITDSYRQEYYEGEAEDMYWVVSTGESKTVPFGEFDDVLRTLEWSPLEPNVVIEKFYAPDVGLLAEHALSGGKEIVELHDVKKP